MWKGVEENLGLSALLKHQGVSIIIISKKQQPVDLAFSKILGLDCSKMNYLSLKSTGHFRSGFESNAGSIFNVDTSGMFTQDFIQYPTSAWEDQCILSKRILNYLKYNSKSN